MKNNLILTYMVFLIISVGCDSKQSLNYPVTPEISGLATTIELDYNETNIVLEDYFLDIGKIDSFSIQAYLSYKITGENFEFLTLNTKDT